MTKIVHEMAPISSIKGEITLPGSKSLTNRFFSSQHWLRVPPTDEPLLSEDTEHMLTALSALGVNHLSAADKHARSMGSAGDSPSNNTRALFLGNAGRRYVH